MRLKELRGDLKQREVVQQIKQTDPRVDSGLYSKYENGVALPTPDQLKAICELLGVAPLDVYSENEIDLKGTAPTVHKASVNDDGELDTYNLCVRLERDAARWFRKDVLAKCGYRNLTHWANVGLLKLKKEYEKAIKQEKKKAARLERQDKRHEN